jgi:succinate dehydrogenase flavin-adding protein (antitoxin of CptAB toxin-antitoxin module)
MDINDDLENIIGTITNGINISQEQKTVLVGAYRIASIKVMLELLIALKASDVEFAQDLNNFFEKHVNSLSEEQRDSYEKSLENGKERTFLEMIRLFMSQFPDSDQEIMRSNIKTLNQSLVGAND